MGSILHFLQNKSSFNKYQPPDASFKRLKFNLQGRTLPPRGEAIPLGWRPFLPLCSSKYYMESVQPW
jgi:hypothetical protein